MNILEAILATQPGGPAHQIAERFGLEQGQAQTAIEALLPMMASAMNRNAEQPGGLEALLGALSDGHHQRYLDDPSTLRDESTARDGTAILGHLFGDREVSREVASRVGAQTGIGADILRKMLPLLAALLMGGLSKGASQGGVSGSRAADERQPGGALPGGLGASIGAGGIDEILGGLIGAGTRPAAGRQDSLGGGLMDMLTPMLDRNRDGSAVDDILGMASRFLQRR